MLRQKLRLVFCATFLLMGSHTVADSLFVFEEGINYAGLGYGKLPDYAGSDDDETSPAPMMRYYFSGLKYAELIGPDLVININDSEEFHYGPYGSLRFGRDDDIDDPVVSRMAEIDNTIELGFFVKSSMQIGDDARHRFNMVADIAYDVGGEHDGYFMSGRVAYFRPIANRAIFNIGAGVGYASDNYMDTFFSVDNADSAASGLPVYKASSGVHDYRVFFGIAQHLSPNWHVGVGGRYQKLLSDAKDSPVVRIRGDEDQWIYGAGLFYVWQ